MKLFAVEGNALLLDGGAMFGNVPRELWKQWLIPDDKNRIRLASRALLYQTDEGRTFLFETGTGTFFDHKMRERFGIQKEHFLLENLASHGIQEKDIDVVILSHLHFDHAGGLLSAYDEGKPRLLFPKATYYVGKEHWERAQNPHLREKASFIPHLQPLLKNSGRLILIDGIRHPDLPETLSFQFFHGHTVGLMLSSLSIGENKLIFAADLIPGMPWIHLPITMGYDRYPELLVNEKKCLFDTMSSAHSALFFTHDPTTICAHIHQEAPGKYLGTPCHLQDFMGSL